MTDSESLAISNSGKYSIQVLTNSGNTTFTNCNAKYQKAKSLARPEAFFLSNDGALVRKVRGSQLNQQEEKDYKAVLKYDCQSTVNTVVYTWGVDLSLNQSDAFGLFDKKSFENINSSEFIVITDKIIR